MCTALTLEPERASTDSEHSEVSLRLVGSQDQTALGSSGQIYSQAVLRLEVWGFRFGASYNPVDWSETAQEEMHSLVWNEVDWNFIEVNIERAFKAHWRSQIVEDVCDEQVFLFVMMAMPCLLLLFLLLQKYIRSSRGIAFSQRRGSLLVLGCQLVFYSSNHVKESLVVNRQDAIRALDKFIQRQQTVVGAHIYIIIFAGENTGREFELFFEVLCCNMWKSVGTKAWASPPSQWVHEEEALERVTCFCSLL